MKSIINKIISRSGYHLEKNNPGRFSFSGAINNIAKFYKPDVIIDVGAARGSWAEKCFIFFPYAEYVLIEPLEEFHPILEKIKNKINKIDIIQKAASSTSGKTTFNVHDDLYGSSLKKEIEGENVDGKKREIETLTIDQMAKTKNLQGKYLIKLDVQGAELEVLAGASEVIKNTECLILEVSLFKSYFNGVDITETIAKLKEFGFVAYDIFGVLYRPYDNALSQIDIIFVKENGLFRKFHGYATERQRQEQNEKFKKELNNFIKL